MIFKVTLTDGILAHTEEFVSLRHMVPPEGLRLRNVIKCRNFCDVVFRITTLPVAELQIQPVHVAPLMVFVLQTQKKMLVGFKAITATVMMNI